MPNAEIYGSYEGAANPAKDLDMFERLKSHAASAYPLHTVGSSRFEVTHREVKGGTVEVHTHYLMLLAPEDRP